MTLEVLDCSSFLNFNIEKVLHCWPVHDWPESSHYASHYSEADYIPGFYNSYGLDHCEIWNETETISVSAPFLPYYIKYTAGSSVLALYKGRATSIVQHIHAIQSFSSKRRWRTVTRFGRYFWDEIDNIYQTSDISAVTLDSGDLIIIGGGQGSCEINKLQNDALTRIGTLKEVFV